jgi:hypothetical protein
MGIDMSERKVVNGIAEFLEQFSKSPYSYPENNRESSVKVSTLKGSWQKPKNT